MIAILRNLAVIAVFTLLFVAVFVFLAGTAIGPLAMAALGGPAYVLSARFGHADRAAL